MGTCLAVIKVAGISTLGLFTGAVVTNVLSSYDILKYVLDKTSTSSNLNQINLFIKSKLALNGIVLSVLGSISTIAFQLAYSGAPPRSKHPYLIYSSLVFPISTAIYYLIAKNDLVKYFKLDSLNNKIKEAKPKTKNEHLKSDLDNSVYKDLGETSSLDENEILEDDEIENEVEFHLNQQTALNALSKVHFADKIVASLSIVGFLIASVGIYGDF